MLYATIASSEHQCVHEPQYASSQSKTEKYGAIYTPYG